MARTRLRFEFGEKLACVFVHRAAIEPSNWPDRSLDLASQENVGRRRQIVAQREVLIDDLDALFARFDRFVEMDGFFVEDYFT